MNTGGRLKRTGGLGTVIRTEIVASGGTIGIRDDDRDIILSATGAVSTSTTAPFQSNRVLPGRRITLIGTDDTNTITLKHTAAASAARDTFTGSADLVLGKNDTATIMQLNSGEWVREASAANA